MRSRLSQVEKRTAQFYPGPDLAIQTNNCKASLYAKSSPCQVSLPGSSFSLEKSLFLAGVCVLHQLFVTFPCQASSSTHYPLILFLVSCFCVSLIFPSLWQSVSDLWLFVLGFSTVQRALVPPQDPLQCCHSWFCLRGSTERAILQPFLHLPSSITTWWCPSCSRDCASSSMRVPQIRGM